MCAYTYIYIYTYIDTILYAHIPICTDMYTCIHTRLFTYIYISISDIHIDIYIYAHVYLYTYACINICRCIYIYMYLRRSLAVGQTRVSCARSVDAAVFWKKHVRAKLLRVHRSGWMVQ